MNYKKLDCYVLSFFLLIYIYNCNCGKSSICNSLTITNKFRSCDSQNQTLFTFNFTVDAEIDNTNAFFPNKLTFSNFSFWTIDYSSYYLTAPIKLISTYYSYICPSLNYPCIYNAFDGEKIDIEFYYYTVGTYSPWTFSQNISNDAIYFLYIDKGSLYSLGDDDGYIFYPSSKICYDGGEFDCYYESKYSSFCCNNFLYYDIPDNNNG